MQASPVPSSQTLFLALFFTLTLGSPPMAHALQDVRVSELESVEDSRRQGYFNFVVRELAMAIAAPPVHSVGALGLYEFEISSDHRLAFLHTSPPAYNLDSPWEAVNESGEASALAYLTGMTFRKGLPWSFEVGGNVSWLGVTRQFVVGGYGRWAIQDGWTRIPDVAIEVGYDGYIGNEELDLGVFSVDVSVGYSFGGSPKSQRPGTRFSPFVGYSYLMAHAQPVSLVDQLVPVTAWLNDTLPGVDARDFRFHRFFGGMEILASQVVFRAAVDVTVPRNGALMAAANLSLGSHF